MSTSKAGPPRVSVVVPNYNHARFLHQRLDSILVQSLQDFEVLILDDCSTDESRDVIAEYQADPRVTAHFNTTNSGSTFRQWAKGLKWARGAFVWFAESDDRAHPTFLERTVELLERHPNVGMATTQSWVIDEKGQRLGSYIDEQAKLYGDVDHWRRDYLNSGPDERATYFYRANPVPNASAVLFRRDVLANRVRIPVKMRLNGDWMLYARVLKVSDIAFLAEPLNDYRHHPNTVRHQSDRVDVAWGEAIMVHRELLRDSNAHQRGAFADEVRAYVFTSIDKARRPPRGKVPPADLPALVRRTSVAGWSGLKLALPILAKETAADLLRGPFGRRNAGAETLDTRKAPPDTA